MPDDLCEVVITAPDPRWLADFTRQLVDEHLVASGHNIDAIRSIYRWQGEVYDRSEGRVALHTRRELVPRIVELVNREHPYDVPGVIVTPVIDGNPAYLQWIRDETAAASG
jgi:periplasmic divalent cation tolerance protein